MTWKAACHYIRRTDVAVAHRVPPVAAPRFKLRSVKLRAPARPKVLRKEVIRAPSETIASFPFHIDIQHQVQKTLKKTKEIE